MKNRRAIFKVVVTRETLVAVPTKQVDKVDKFVTECFNQCPLDELHGWHDDEKFVWHGTASVEVTKAAVTVMAELAKGNVTEALMMIDIYKDRQVTNAQNLAEHENVSYKSNQEETS